MANILVSGLINIETTLKVEAFPIHYNPVNYPFWGVRSTVSGVGYNVAKALVTLGDDVRFLSVVGDDQAAGLVYRALEDDSIPTADVLPVLPETAQSVIIYDATGQRQIHTDLKNIQEVAFPADWFEAALAWCELAVLCNINFSRPFLTTSQKTATDVHEISDLDDPYNHDYMANADILFMSGNSIPGPPRQWLERIQERFNPELAVVTLGERGSLLAVRGERVFHQRAVQTRPVVNTVGAGDSVFSSFIHFYLKSGDARQAMEKATYFASYKIGERGAAEGFLDETALEVLIRQHAVT